MLTVRVHSLSLGGVAELLAGTPGITLTQKPAGHLPSSALIAFRDPGDEDISRYGWIHVAGAGADRVLKALERGAGSPILTRTIGAMGRQMGEYVLAYALAHLQRIERRRAFEAEADWQKEASLPRQLFDQRVAIIGTGPMGQGMAAMLTPLAAEVTGYNRSGRPAPGFTCVRSLEAFAGGALGSDIVVAALPSTPDTEGIVGERIFGALSGALFINVGRGSTVDEGAVRRALDAGRLARAVLDVHRREPLPEEHWTWAHPKVTVTPHVSAVTRPEDIAAAFLERLPMFLNGTLEDEVDREAGYAAR